MSGRTYNPRADPAEPACHAAEHFRLLPLDVGRSLITASPGPIHAVTSSLSNPQTAPGQAVRAGPDETVLISRGALAAPVVALGQCGDLGERGRRPVRA
jgi:hypothetical protein